VCEKETHILVIVCSCSSSALTKDDRFPAAETYITSLPELPHLQDFISNFIPHGSLTAKLNIAKQQTYLQLLSRGGLQVQDIVLRSKKYIRNPSRILGLANRTRIYSQGLLNPRLWFNIIIVIAWLLIRRTLEVFGIHLPGLAVTSQNQQVPPVERDNTNEEAIDRSEDPEFVYLDAP